MKKKIIQSIILTAVFFNFSKAQNPIFKEATVSHPAQLWNPILIEDNGNNIIEGVKLYSHDFECNSQKVNLLKLVNINHTKIKFTYQISESSPIISVIIPASSSPEGKCDSNDSTIEKLIIPFPINKTEEEKLIEYLRSHISILKIQ